MQRFILSLIFMVCSVSNLRAATNTGQCGENCTWVFDEQKGEITISGHGDMYSDTGWTSWKSINSLGSKLKSVVIEEGITSVAGGMFMAINGDLGVTSVSLPSTLERIDGNAFRGLGNLKNIVIPDGVTSIGGTAFRSTPLDNIVIPSSVTEIGAYAFDGYHGSRTIIFEGTPPNGENRAYWDMGDVQVFCKANTDCSKFSGAYTYLSDNYYDIKNGLYVLTDAQGNVIEDSKLGPSYFINTELMIKGAACHSVEQCDEIVTASDSNKSFIVNGKFYKSIDDWVSGNYERKRIYTVEEAEMLSKKTGNSFKVRYK